MTTPVGSNNDHFFHDVAIPMTLITTGIAIGATLALNTSYIALKVMGVALALFSSYPLLKGFYLYAWEKKSFEESCKGLRGVVTDFLGEITLKVERFEQWLRGSSFTQQD